MKRRPPEKWKLEDLPGVVAQSKNLTEVCLRLGINAEYLNYESLKSRIRDAGLGTSHFVPPLDKNSVKFWLLDKEVFVQESKWKITNARLKDRIRKGKLLIEVCIKCGQGDTWKGKPLVLVLDHINGEHSDNRLENLRFLCPNCNSQTPTFAGRNRKRKRLQRESCL